MSGPMGGGYIRCDPARLSFAQSLSELSGWPLVDSDQPLTLWIRNDGLELVDREAGWQFRCRFDSGPIAKRLQAASQERLIRAIGYRHDPWLVADATGGFARDAALMAMAGPSVRLYERHPIVAAMVRDGLEAATAHTERLRGLSRIDLRPGDAIEALCVDEPRPQVVYLDPMFEQHGSAQVRKSSQALRRLVGPTPDATQLLEAALQTATQRVVVKRPVNADPLGGRTPASSLRQSNTRFDLYPV